MCMKEATILLLSILSLAMATRDGNDVQAVDDAGADIHRQHRQFYRFGRAVPPQDSPEEDDRIFNSLVTHLTDHFSDSTVNNKENLFRHRREFYRFGRQQQLDTGNRIFSYVPFSQTDGDQNILADLYEPVTRMLRKNRSSDFKNQSEKFFQASVQSDNKEQLSDIPFNKVANGIAMELNDHETHALIGEKSDDFTKLHEKISYPDKFIIYNKRFMRFGRANGGYEFNNKRFWELENQLQPKQVLNERSMAFGKRFMRFGRGNDDNESYVKRFMRFGKRFYDNKDNKRFIFGRSTADGINKKRFMFGRSMEFGKNNKRFMFGRSMEDDRGNKRFMRFGKRFMRFGRLDNGDDKQAIEIDQENKVVNHQQSKR